MENNINIGDLDTKVTLFAPTASRGNEGEKSATYTEHSEVFAKVEREVTDRLDFENYDGREIVSLTMYKVMDMTTKWQVGISGKRYEILSVDTISRISLFCIVSIQSID